MYTRCVSRQFFFHLKNLISSSVTKHWCGGKFLHFFFFNSQSMKWCNFKKKLLHDISLVVLSKVFKKLFKIRFCQVSEHMRGEALRDFLTLKDALGPILIWKIEFWIKGLGIRKQSRFIRRFNCKCSNQIFKNLKLLLHKNTSRL